MGCLTLFYFCRILSKVNSYLDTIEKDIENDKATDTGEFMNWLALADLKNIPYVLVSYAIYLPKQISHISYISMKIPMQNRP